MVWRIMNSSLSKKGIVASTVCTMQQQQATTAVDNGVLLAAVGWLLAAVWGWCCSASQGVKQFFCFWKRVGDSWFKSKPHS
jgi:hypothetical protein